MSVQDGRSMPLQRLIAVVMLVLLSPLFMAIALTIAIDDSRPIIFRQVRAGLNGEPFVLLKFRTMIVDADRFLDEQGRPTRERTTRVGRVLRRWSLDELPQLVNVLRGEMALVGPRPVPLEYVSAMDDCQQRRFQVRPGMTGLAQVRGRHRDPWTIRLAHDVEYVASRSLLLDLSILARTVVTLLRPSSVIDRNPANLDLDVGESDD